MDVVDSDDDNVDVVKKDMDTLPPEDVEMMNFENHKRSSMVSLEDESDKKHKTKTANSHKNWVPCLGSET